MNEEEIKVDGAVSLADADALHVARAAMEILDNKKAHAVALFHVEAHSDITDYLVLATGNSGTHIRALADELEYQLGLRGILPCHRDGVQANGWKVVDYGAVMVHIFDRETREFYNLDKLYGDSVQTEAPIAEKETL